MPRILPGIPEYFPESYKINKEKHKNTSAIITGIKALITLIILSVPRILSMYCWEVPADLIDVSSKISCPFLSLAIISIFIHIWLYCQFIRNLPDIKD
jgi:hypothetical protein